MRNWLWVMLVLLAGSTAAFGQQDYESVYAPPSPLGEGEAVNLGAVHLDLDVRYLTDYIWRGIERFDQIGDQEDAANTQFDGTVSWDLGKAPHPFASLFVNTQEADPISNFEEIRPTVGFDWNLRPLILTAAHVSYIFPDRDRLDTNEIFGKIQIDDSYFLRTKDQILSPFASAAYDYDVYRGWYFEAGVEHVFEFEDIGLTVTAKGLVAFSRGYDLFAVEEDNDTGLKHYELGIEAKYSLNRFFNFSKRFGDWSVNGYLNYADGIDNDLRTDTQLWGGAGIGFSY